MNLSIGEQVSLHRKRAGLSQNQLAKKSGISRQAISLLEAGHGNPKVETLRALGKALKMQVRIEFEAVE